MGRRKPPFLLVQREFPMAEKLTKVACPTCGKEVVWRSDNAFRPFCSERCKMIDLGAWANEAYKVPAENGSFEEDIERPA